MFVANCTEELRTITKKYDFVYRKQRSSNPKTQYFIIKYVFQIFPRGIAFTVILQNKLFTPYRNLRIQKEYILFRKFGASDKKNP